MHFQYFSNGGWAIIQIAREVQPVVRNDTGEKRNPVNLKNLLTISAFALVMTVSARADLIGTSVTGQLLFNGSSTNYFESANGFVPAGYGNSGLGTSTTVTIGAGIIEFGYNDSLNADTVDFTGTTVTLTDVTGEGSIKANYVFTDTAFSGLNLSLVSNNFPSGFSATLVGDVLTLSAPSFNSGGAYTAEYSFASTPVASTPEPSSVILLLTTLLAVAFVARKRIAQRH